MSQQGKAGESLPRGAVQLDRLAHLTQGLRVEFDEELGEAQMRLMETLGVEVVVKRPVRPRVRPHVRREP